MKRKEYYFVDGMAGVVLAHSLKQAVRLLIKNDLCWEFKHSNGINNPKRMSKFLFKQYMRELKLQDKNPEKYDFSEADICVEKYTSTEKGKSRVIGYSE